MFKPRSVYFIIFLCVVAAVGLYFWDQSKVYERVNDPDEIWTITMENEATSYTFRGPLDMFRIHRSLVSARPEINKRLI